jgi:phospho-2-dehydro-3-deoxyheptonate aldolase
VLQGRETVRRILDREDPRLFVVVGPCSIHDINELKGPSSIISAQESGQITVSADIDQKL